MSNGASVSTHTLKLFTSESELLCMPISEEAFEAYLNHGVPEEILEQMEDYSEYSLPIFDENTSLAVDGSYLDTFNQDMQPRYEAALQKARSESAVPAYTGGCALISSRYIKRAWYELQIDGEFDAGKLSIELDLEHGIDPREPVATYQLYYDGRPFEFSTSHGVHTEMVYLRDGSGELFDFEMAGDE